jgi:hypothetical protein
MFRYLTAVFSYGNPCKHTPDLKVFVVIIKLPAVEADLLALKTNNQTN